MSKLTKYEGGAVAKTTTGALAKGGAAQKPIKVKHVMLLDTGDGAFTDQSVKVKPCRGDDRKLVLKCTDPQRLLDAAKRMGLALAGAPTKGAKHWILFVWKAQFGEKLLSQGAAGGMLDAGMTAKPVPAFQSKTVKALPKGGAK